MKTDLAAVDFGAGFHLSLRQARQRGQVFMTRCGRMRVVGLVPVESGESTWHPVEVMTHQPTRRVGQREIDEEDALGPEVEVFGNGYDALRAVGGGVHGQLRRVDLVPLQSMNLHAGL